MVKRPGLFGKGWSFFPALFFGGLVVLSSLLFLPKAAYASGDRYWVGGTGNWSDTSHWSAISGGSGGASVPDNSTNCYFDASSFSGSGQTVTLDESGGCDTMDWTGATNSPTFTMSNPLTIGGSFTLTSGMTVNGLSPGITFNSLGTNTITLAGHALPLINVEMIFAGGGTWTLQDAWNMPSLQVYMAQGTLNTNNQNFLVRQIYDNTNNDGGGLDDPGNVTVNFGSSNVTIIDTLALALDSTTLIGTSSNITIAPDVDNTIFFVNGTAQFNSFHAEAGTPSEPTSNRLQTFGTIFADTLTLDPIGTSTWPVGAFETDDLVSNGNSGNLVNISGNFQAEAQISADYLDITDSTCLGVTPCYAGTHSVDGGGNANWIFTAPPPPDVISVTGQNPALATTSTPSITINGSGFAPTPTVTVGGTAATNVTYVDAGTLTATAPAKGLGSYDVVVTNPDTSTATCAGCMLYVSAPGVPTDATSTPGNDQASLSWSAPVSDGGSPLIDYLVQYKLSASSTFDSTFDTNSTSTMTIVTGLMNGSSYDFEVVAENAAGSSTPSSIVSASLAATVPDPPTSVSATAGNGQAVVSFSAPDNDGGSPITAYTVTSNPGNITATGSSSPITITGLTIGVGYTFTVTAGNTLGDSVSSSPSGTVTPFVPYAASALLGQVDGSGNPLWTDSGSNNSSGSVNLQGFHNPSDVTVDSVNHRLFVSDTGNKRVLVFSLDTTDNIASTTALYALGSGISSFEPEYLSYDPINQRLFVGDDGNQTVEVFNVATSTISDSESPDNTLNYLTDNGAVPAGLAYDSVNQRLFVGDDGNQTVEVFNVATSTISDSESPDNTLDYLADSGAAPIGLAYDSVNQRLFVGDYNNETVYAFNVATSTISNSESPDNTLDYLADSGAAPIGLAYDSVNQRLFVADNNNDTTWAFNTSTSTISDSESPEIYLPNGARGAATQSSFLENAGLAYDSGNYHLFLVDQNANRVMQFNLIKLTTGSLASATVGSAYSQTLTTAFSQGIVAFSLYASSTLPSGLVLNSSTGVISGTPASPGTYSFVVEADDTIGGNGNFFDRQPYSMTVSAPSLGGAGGGGGGGGVSYGSGNYTPPANQQPASSLPTSSPASSLPFMPSAPVSAAPNLKLINNKGTFYFIDNGISYGIANPGILNSYGLTFKDAVSPTAQDLSLPQGGLLTPADGSLVKTLKDPTVYFISNQTRYGFTSAKVFLALGFKFSSALVVTTPELQALAAGPVIKDATAAHLPGTDINYKGTIYYIGRDYLRHPYLSLAVYNSWNIANNFSAVVPANAADLKLGAGSAVSQRTLN